MLYYCIVKINEFRGRKRNRTGLFWPECTQKKLESQHVYLTLLTRDLYVIFRVKICVGVASTKMFRKTMQRVTLIFAV